MAFTDVQIYNHALLRLGIDQISGFSDGTAEADAGDSIYAVTRDSLLEAAPWTFAHRFGTALTVDATTPTIDWEYRFQLPADLRTLLRVHDSGVEIPYLKVDDQYIYVDQNTSVYIDYIRDVDESDFPNLFVQALSAQLAVDVCMTLTADPELLQLMRQEAGFWLAKAAHKEAFQQASRTLANPRQLER